MELEAQLHSGVGTPVSFAGEKDTVAKAAEELRTFHVENAWTSLQANLRLSQAR